ncbi:MAG: DUF1538 domain-containing protein [Clostridia bacterium]|nr:DUF1538 domain-containing protein [Clostridia bacterium]
MSKTKRTSRRFGKRSAGKDFNTFKQKLTKPFNKDSVFLSVVKESLASVLPIALIVLLLSTTLTPLSNNAVMAFLIGTVLLIVGMGFFNMGAETALTPFGQIVGKELTKSKKIWLIALVSFFIGLAITIAEPDLQVLAEQVSSVPNLVMIGVVAVGVAVFLVIAVMRVVLGVPLRILLLVMYGILFVLAAFVSPKFWAIAFDGGGVTTGPMTVPFILALGVGVSSLSRGKQAEDDSFGLVALCPVGPIIAVLALGLIYKPDDLVYVPTAIPDPANMQETALLFLRALPSYMREMGVALAPIALFLICFQIISRKISKKEFLRIVIGLLYTFVGLTLFLTGANVGFMPVGRLLGANIAGLEHKWLLVPIAMLIGYFIVKAEPAVGVLNKQVEEITLGKIPARAMNVSLSVGIAASLGLSMVRVLTGVSIMYFVAPMYGISLILSFFVPKIFTAIAFDSGGVASGPMTAAFLMPFAIGACLTISGAEAVFTDAFGVVAMVAATPLITIQILGLAYKIRTAKATKPTADLSAASYEVLTDGVIELE